MSDTSYRIEWYLNNTGEPTIRYGSSTHDEYIPLTYLRIER